MKKFIIILILLMLCLISLNNALANSETSQNIENQGFFSKIWNFIVYLFTGRRLRVTPLCGNGILEKGETPETCCLDAGCKEREVCKNNICIELPIKCGHCQYLVNKICKDYICCRDLDCNDNDPETTNKCINPQTISAKCTYIKIEPTVQDIITGAPQPTDECRINSDCDDNDVSTKDMFRST